jgi:PBSX family phage terminase large subunit
MTSTQEPTSFRPHSQKQDVCVFSDKAIVILACGIQFGKTIAGATRIKLAMHKYRDPSDAFIITAPTYKILQQATLPAFLSQMRGHGEYSKGDAVFRMHNGGTCYFRTATDPDSVVGITNVRAIWGDEAGLYPLYFHENLQARAAFRQCPIVYTTSPYSLNWIYTDYIRPFRKDPNTHPDLELIQARSNENPYFPEAEYKKKKATMDPRRFNMIFGGEFNKIEGLVYNNFAEDIHVCEPHTLPEGTIFIGGVDWGYTNPAVILVFGICPDGKIFLVAEHYKTQQTIGEMVDVAKRLKLVYNIDRFYCDPSSPANIAEFNKARLTAIGATNDIRPGVDSMYELIESDRFKVFSGRAPNFVDEAIHADKDIKERNPVAQYDHAMDAARYVTYALKLTGIKKRGVVVPGMTKHDLRHHAQDTLLLQNVTEEFDW